MVEFNLNIDIDIAKAKAQAKKKKPLGVRIYENIVGDDDPTTQNFGEKVGTALNMAGEAMTGGLVGDEASGAVAEMIPGGMTGKERVAFERQQQRLLEESNPGVALASQVAGGLATPVAAATSLPAAIGIGAAMGGTYAFMEGEGNAKDRLPGGLVGTAFGALGGAASVPLGKVLGWAGKKFGRAARGIFANKKFFDGNTLTKEGRETLEALGYNADEISDDFVKAFRSRAADLSADDAARAAGMDEFGIPVYRHNATGTADDFAAFERAKRGALGPRVEETARKAADKQINAATGAADDISSNLGGGPGGSIRRSYCGPGRIAQATGVSQGRSIESL